MFRALQTSLNGGQLSRRLHARTDLAIHAIAAAEMTNVVPTIEGAAIKRPGTRWRTYASPTAMRLTDFVFNATQSYLIEWSPGKLRFITNNALVLDGDDPLEVTVPYLAADIERVCYEQSGDVLYLAHGNHPPATLSRTSATSFSYAPLDLAGGPFADPNTDDTITVTVTGDLDVGGAVTITASAGIFAPGHVGSRFRVEAKDFGSVGAWQEGIDSIFPGVQRRSEGRVYEAETGGRTGFNQPIHDTGSEWDGDGTGQDINGKGPYGVLWRYLHDRFGIIKITARTSDTVVTGVVERAVPRSLATVPSPLWAHGLFSAAEGWPEHVFLWRGRLWWISGFILAGSVAGDYRDFNEFGPDGSREGDQAIRLRMDLTDRVLWVRADRSQVLLGTARGEYAITVLNPGEGVTASNLGITRQRRHGSEAVWPVEAGGEIFFTQRGGRKLRAAAYVFNDDRYAARWVNIYARFATMSGVRELAYQAEPEELIWVLRGDGTAAAHPIAIEQEVKGFTLGLAIEGAAIRSMQVIPSPDGKRDDLWLLVDRGGVLSLEQLADWPDDDALLAIEDSYHLDSGATFQLSDESTISGLGHLAGREVMLLVGGVAESGVVSPAGVLDLGRNVTGRVHVGLLFTARIRLLDPDIPRLQRNGSSAGMLRKTQRIGLYLIDSVTVQAGRLASLLQRVLKFRASDPMPEAQPLETGWSDPLLIAGNRERNHGDVIEDRSPYPLIVGAIVREIDSE
ncbi:MAG: hypothetical protein ACK4IS_13350 [Erythrobacter sp.]